MSEDLRKYFQITSFPDPMTASEDGVLCFGGEFERDLLLDAYIHGIFPWPHEGYPLLWFFPKERGVLDFKDLHIPQSLGKLIKKNLYTFRMNTRFNDVIEQCSLVPRKNQKGTWITDEMQVAYKDLYDEGHILCIECYRKNSNGDEVLVGGLYGVLVAGVFSGESMFGLESNVSKLCVIEAIKRLQGIGLDWMDIQMVTPVLESLGGKYISREEYKQRLDAVHKIFIKA
ncbi:MAG: leucyl/phenylalanyl-tRNA--protein transferase [Bdellovibrionota bacterium]